MVINFLMFWTVSREHGVRLILLFLCLILTGQVVLKQHCIVCILGWMLVHHGSETGPT